ncbi:MAG: hypothetical protein ABH878_04065, partial [bacterium]
QQKQDSQQNEQQEQQQEQQKQQQEEQSKPQQEEQQNLNQQQASADSTLSKEDAERLLNALQLNEKRVQENLRKRKAQETGGGKDW